MGASAPGSILETGQALLKETLSPYTDKMLSLPHIEKTDYYPFLNISQKSQTQLKMKQKNFIYSLYKSLLSQSNRTKNILNKIFVSDIDIDIICNFPYRLIII